MTVTTAPKTLVRVALTEIARDRLVEACNDQLSDVTDVASPDFEFWYELRKQLSSAEAKSTERKPRAKKASPNGVPVAAPALATV